MSLINRESDYAIRILRVLSKKEICSIPQICEEQVIGKPFAYKISKKLEKAGLIGVKRGINGGLFLACDLSKTSLWDVLNALDNIQYVNDCFENGYKCECSNGDLCRTHHKLIALQESINTQLKATLLSDIL